MKTQVLAARKASAKLALLTRPQKDRILSAMASALKAGTATILRANQKDLRRAKKKGMPAAMLARLALDASQVQKIARAIRAIAALPDPVGRVLSEKRRPNGLRVRKLSVPIGVILIIYESRPNVTADCMALCLKSGNSVVLKGGREALFSNRALFGVLEKAATRAGAPKGAFTLVATSSRAAVHGLLRMDDLIDLVIPRGGEGLIREVARVSRIPVIKHYKGVCHVYVDKDADLKKAERIVLNAKTQNPAVCNAMECLLVHRAVAKKFIPRMIAALRHKKVEVRGDARVVSLSRGAKRATAKDWGREYLDLTVSARVVRDAGEAIAFIERYGSRHSDAIITENRKAAQMFTASVDSAAVFVNSSTRFNDGGQFGLGAEMGISTDKLHARGPMGLEELTSYKYVVWGDGQIRQ